MPVRFFGPANTHTGYGNAVINFTKAFSMSGIRTKFVLNGSGTSGLLDSLNNYDSITNVDFYLHCPPYNRHKSKSYKIGYFYWEADRLPRFWASSLGYLNEIWAPCNLTKEACQRAGFRGKIKVVPTPSEDFYTEKRAVIPSNLSDGYTVSNDVYKFYSIFQWQNRKGYKTLLNAYYKTFKEGDKVILLLKVNPLNIKGSNYEGIKQDILEIKRKLNQKYYPPIYLMRDIIKTEEIRALHNIGDCFVSSHHGEGWGMPIHDAMLSKKQIIVTRYGGVTEWLSDQSAHIINHSLGPVVDMDWCQLYGSYQNWAYPDVNHLMKLFRDVYENHDKYGHKAEKAREIGKSFDIESVSKIISRELSDFK
jgi:hypothetical protein